MSLCDFEATEEFLDLKPSTRKATVRRPKKDEPIQVLTEKAHKNLVLAERNSQFFLVGKKAQLSLKKQAKTYVLVPCITQNGEMFFWPLLSSMAKTFKQLEEGKTGWLKIGWSKSSRGYEVSPLTGQNDSPNWPSDNFEVAGEAAFGGRLIKDKDDPIVTLIQAAKKRPKPTS